MRKYREEVVRESIIIKINNDSGEKEYNKKVERDNDRKKYNKRKIISREKVGRE